MKEEPLTPEEREEPLPEEPLRPRSQRRKSRVKPPVTTDRVGAGAAGISGGSLVAVIASTLPEGTAKTVLIWFSPTAAIACTALWIFIRRWFVNLMEEREANAAYMGARTSIDEALKNVNLSAEHKAAFEQQRMELDQMNVARKMAKATRHIRQG